MKENPMFTLVIGNKNLSSWSLRPWLVLKMLDEPFIEQLITLEQLDAKSRILAVSPAGKVPVLLDGKVRVWDSLAICEYLAECFPAARLWPEDRAERALARAVAATTISSCPRRPRPTSTASSRCGKSCCTATRTTGRSCSVTSPSPTPCTPRW